MDFILQALDEDDRGRGIDRARFLQAYDPFDAGVCVSRQRLLAGDVAERVDCEGALFLVLAWALEGDRRAIERFTVATQGLGAGGAFMETYLEGIGEIWSKYPGTLDDVVSGSPNHLENVARAVFRYILSSDSTNGPEACASMREVLSVAPRIAQRVADLLTEQGEADCRLRR